VKKTEADEQMTLIDVGPENLKEISQLARQYRSIVKENRMLLSREIDMKGKILKLIKAAELKRLPDGNIRFKCDGLLIIVKFRDELIQIKEEKSAKSKKEKGIAAVVAETKDK